MGHASNDWKVALKSDTALNDSDKTFTVSDKEEWHVYSIFASFVSDATVGNRQLAILFTDASDNVIHEARAGAVQAASLTRTYNAAPGLADLTSFRDTTHLSVPIPGSLVLPPGYKIRVYDKGAVAATTDDMTVRILYAWRNVP